MAKICETAKLLPPYPFSFSSETKAKIHIFCINCELKNALSERPARKDRRQKLPRVESSRLPSLKADGHRERNT